MFVPEWLVILLASFTLILFIFVLVVSGHLLKHWIKFRRYDRLRPTLTQNYATGLTQSYFYGDYQHNCSFVPVTTPTKVQAGSPIVFPSFKPRSKASSVGSARSTNSGSNGRVARRHHLSWNRLQSLDDKQLQKSRHQLSISPTAQRASPLRHSSDFAISGENTGRDSPPPYIIDCTLDDYIDTLNSVYSHSVFLPVQDNSLDTVPIISYDQEEDFHYQEEATPGSLNFKLEYDSSVPELRITVEHASNLRLGTEGSKGIINSYVNLCIVPEDFLWQRTKVVKNSLSPVYDETFKIQDVLYHKLREYTMCFYVMDTSPLQGERVIGKILYPLCDLRSEQSIEVCKELSFP